METGVRMGKQEQPTDADAPMPDQIWQSRKSTKKICIVEVFSNGVNVDDLVEVPTPGGGKDPTPAGHVRFMSLAALNRSYLPT